MLMFTLSSFNFLFPYLSTVLGGINMAQSCSIPGLIGVSVLLLKNAKRKTRSRSGELAIGYRSLIVSLLYE